MRWISTCVLILLLQASVSARAETTVWKTEPFAADCVEADGPKLDKDGNPLEGEHDFVLHKCKTKFGPLMWLLYQDSARMSIGFGSTPNAVWTGASLDRGDWPIEWGGVMSAGAFKPRSATVRFNFWDGDQATKSNLIVYKLAGSSPACIVAMTDRNEAARQIASGIHANTKCQREADLH